MFYQLMIKFQSCSRLKSLVCDLHTFFFFFSCPVLLLFISLCCRKGDPFQGPRMDSCLTLGNELSKETHVLTKQESLLGSGTRAESRNVRQPRRTALQSLVLWRWD